MTYVTPKLLDSNRLWCEMVSAMTHHVQLPRSSYDLRVAPFGAGWVSVQLVLTTWSPGKRPKVEQLGVRYVRSQVELEDYGNRLMREIYTELVRYWDELEPPLEDV